MKQQSGFTLIELVVVIVLLGILGAAATAKFQDLSAEARAAAIQGIAAEMQSGSAINYAKKAVSPGATGLATVASCPDGANVLTTTLNSNYNIPAGGSCGADGTSIACTLEDTNVTPPLEQDFSLICTSS